MTLHVNIARAKATLSELVARAEAGEEVVLMRNGKPVVTLTPSASLATGPRPLGLWDHLGLDIDGKAFLEADAEVDALMDASVFPER